MSDSWYYIGTHDWPSIDLSSSELSSEEIIGVLGKVTNRYPAALQSLAATPIEGLSSTGQSGIPELRPRPVDL